MPAGGAESFVLQLATAATPEALERWLADAAPRGRVIYAQGADLPREAPGVKLVQRWIEAGLVTAFIQRDPADARRFQFMAERCGVGVPGQAVNAAAGDDGAGESALAARTQRQMKQVLALLVQAAKEHRPCPSHADVARELGLPRTARGRRRAGYLVERLQREAAIDICRPTATTRVVTIARGPWAGKQTAAPVGVPVGSNAKGMRA